MPDLIQTVIGVRQKISLNGQQRLVIETAHGLIELRTRFENPDRSAKFELIMPADLRWRKGAKHKPISLHTKFLDIVAEMPVPMFQLLSPVLLDGEAFYLRGVTRLRVAASPSPAPATPAFDSGN